MTTTSSHHGALDTGTGTGSTCTQMASTGVQGEWVGARTVTGRWVDSHHRAEGWNICLAARSPGPTGGDP
ncbi:unnamed protein product [Gadus morhua 'NCC']